MQINFLKGMLVIVIMYVPTYNYHRIFKHFEIIVHWLIFTLNAVSFEGSSISEDEIKYIYYYMDGVPLLSSGINEVSSFYWLEKEGATSEFQISHVLFYQDSHFTKQHTEH